MAKGKRRNYRKAATSGISKLVTMAPRLVEAATLLFPLVWAGDAAIRERNFEKARNRLSAGYVGYDGGAWNLQYVIPTYGPTLGLEGYKAGKKLIRGLGRLL